MVQQRAPAQVRNRSCRKFPVPPIGDIAGLSDGKVDARCPGWVPDDRLWLCVRLNICIMCILHTLNAFTCCLAEYQQVQRAVSDGQILSTLGAQQAKRREQTFLCGEWRFHHTIWKVELF